MVGRHQSAKPPARFIVPALTFSFVINLLYLIGPIFMMQVYDRVLSSGSVSTLVGLSLIAGLLYAFFGCMDYIRTQLLMSRGEAFAQYLAKKAFSQSLKGYALDDPTSARRNAIEDVASVRQFLVSSGFTAILDLMWMPIFLGFIFILHKTLGVTAIVAATILVLMAVVNERSSRKAMQADGVLKQKSKRWAGQVQRQADSIIGNGMETAMADRWYEQEEASRLSTAKINGRSTVFTSLTKTTRLAMQSLILALGAYLAINMEMSAGAMIAASIIFSRTIAPVEQILGHFTPMVRAREAWQRVKTWKDAALIDDKIAMPMPKQSLSAQILALTPPDSTVTVLQKVQLSLNAGAVLGVIGSSGGGKSSLAKALCGAWAPQNGSIKLDGADLREWPQEQLGKAIGYMPQDSALFDGTIAENIAGFSAEASSQDIIDACMIAEAHSLILSLPNSYNTHVGPTGLQLSAGQRQRISLARALFGNPFLVVLDEPNSNLDEAGEAALAKTIANLKAMNKIVVVVAHRQDVLKEATHLCVIENGVMSICGPKEAVQKRLAAKVGAQSKKKHQEAPAATKPSQLSQPFGAQVLSQQNGQAVSESTFPAANLNHKAVEYKGQTVANTAQHYNERAAQPLTALHHSRQNSRQNSRQADIHEGRAQSSPVTYENPYNAARSQISVGPASNPYAHSGAIPSFLN